MKKLFSLRRRLTAVIAATVCAAALIVSMLSVKSILVSGVPEPSSRSPLILIDPGHGGKDAGAVGIGGLLEKDINLEISLYLRDILRLMGYRVRMTRRTDVLLEGKGSSAKSRDLNARLDEINKDDVSFCISIHQNSFSGNGTARGLQVFCRPNCESSMLLAQSIQQTVKDLIQPENHRSVKTADSSIYILKNAKNPAVLIECAFLSDPMDALTLSKQSGKADIAFSIACAIAKYLQNGA